MASIFALLPTWILCVVAIATVGTVIETILGLRATARLQKRLAAAASDDQQLKIVIGEAMSRRLTDAEEAEAIAAIRNRLKELSSPDRRRVEAGLAQTSRAGKANYVKNLLTPPPNPSHTSANSR